MRSAMALILLWGLGCSDSGATCGTRTGLYEVSATPTSGGFCGDLDPRRIFSIEEIEGRRGIDWPCAAVQEPASVGRVPFQPQGGCETSLEVRWVRVDYVGVTAYRAQTTSIKRQQISWESDGTMGSGTVDFEIETTREGGQDDTSTTCSYAVTYRKVS
jgi:hypothetical protein